MWIVIWHLLGEEFITELLRMSFQVIVSSVLKFFNKCGIHKSPDTYFSMIYATGCFWCFEEVWWKGIQIVASWRVHSNGRACWQKRTWQNWHSYCHVSRWSSRWEWSEAYNCWKRNKTRISVPINLHNDPPSFTCWRIEGILISGPLIYHLN